MHKKVLFSLLTAALFSCNNSSNEPNTTGDSADKKTSADTSQSMSTMSTTVPDLPAVPDGARVYFKNLKNNATVASPVKVEMGIDKMKIDTAGPVVAGSGHYHIFVDAEDSLAAGTMVPKDSTHLHYGKGQTEASVALAPGKHKLTLQFADGLHRSYGGKLATTVNIVVKK